MSLSYDEFGRTVCTHMCPECGARFLGEAECRGVGDGPGKRAHDGLITALPIHGCTPPPDRRWVVGLPVQIMAPTEAKAYEMARHTVEDYFPKRFVESHGYLLHPVALETVTQANFQRRMDFARKRSRERAA